MTIDLTEVKAYLDANFVFEDEKVLEKVTENLKRVLENSLFDMIKTDNIYSSFKKNIEKVVESNPRGIVKDYFLVLDENKDKREFHLQGYIELK